MEFGRRMAVERECQKSDAFNRTSIIFDESSNFILYGTMLGVKVGVKACSMMHEILLDGEYLSKGLCW